LCNFALQESIRARGRGIVLGTDHSLYHSGINELAVALGLSPFSTSLLMLPVQTITSSADFNRGNMSSVNADTFAGSLVLNQFTSTPFPLLWVPLSGRGQIAKIHTVTGRILAVFRSGPDGYPTDPSRSTVDALGGVWAGNRAQGGSYGTVVHIGLLELNQCVDRNNNKKIDTASVGGLVAWCVLGGRAGVGSCIRAHVLEDVVARVRN
jgi:hypothetical protein